MTTRRDFCEAVAADPGDATARLVFADRLDDHGEADRAAFVREPCELTRFGPPSPPGGRPAL